MISIEYLRGQRESVVVRSDGGVTWIPPFKMISTCAMENTDVANCKLKFGSWTYNGFKLNISMVSYPMGWFLKYQHSKVGGTCSSPAMSHWL